jgi:hypothetical protein
MQCLASNGQHPQVIRPHTLWAGLHWTLPGCTHERHYEQGRSEATSAPCTALPVNTKNVKKHTHTHTNTEKKQKKKQAQEIKILSRQPFFRKLHVDGTKMKTMMTKHKERILKCKEHKPYPSFYALDKNRMTLCCTSYGGPIFSAPLLC